MSKAPRRKKTGHPGHPITKTPPAIKPFIFVPMSDLSDIPFSPLAFLIEAHSSLYLPLIQSFFSFFRPQIKRLKHQLKVCIPLQKKQMPYYFQLL